MIVGLISDTHGLMREEALRALQGSGLIIHAGDVGRPEILDTLRTIAPVVAVKGNIDQGSWADRLPESAIARAGPALIYVIHDVHDLDSGGKDSPFPAAGCHAIVSGHSHKHGSVERSGVLYINPGSAGPRRFNLPVTVAVLDLRPTPWKVDFIDLSI